MGSTAAYSLLSSSLLKTTSPYVIVNKNDGIIKQSAKHISGILSSSILILVGIIETVIYGLFTLLTKIGHFLLLKNSSFSLKLDHSILQPLLTRSFIAAGNVVIAASRVVTHFQGAERVANADQAITQAFTFLASSNPIKSFQYCHINGFDNRPIKEVETNSTSPASSQPAPAKWNRERKYVLIGIGLLACAFLAYKVYTSYSFVDTISNPLQEPSSTGDVPFTQEIPSPYVPSKANLKTPSTLTTSSPAEVSTSSVDRSPIPKVVSDVGTNVTNRENPPSTPDTSSIPTPIQDMPVADNISTESQSSSKAEGLERLIAQVTRLGNLFFITAFAYRKLQSRANQKLRSSIQSASKTGSSSIPQLRSTHEEEPLSPTVTDSSSDASQSNSSIVTDSSSDISQIEQQLPPLTPSAAPTSSSASAAAAISPQESLPLPFSPISSSAITVPVASPKTIGAAQPPLSSAQKRRERRALPESRRVPSSAEKGTASLQPSPEKENTGSLPAPQSPQPDKDGFLYRPDTSPSPQQTVEGTVAFNAVDKQRLPAPTRSGIALPTEPVATPGPSLLDYLLPATKQSSPIAPRYPITDLDQTRTSLQGSPGTVAPSNPSSEQQPASLASASLNTQSQQEGSSSHSSPSLASLAPKPSDPPSGSSQAHSTPTQKPKKKRASGRFQTPARATLLAQLDHIQDTDPGIMQKLQDLAIEITGKYTRQLENPHLTKSQIEEIRNKIFIPVPSSIYSPGYSFSLSQKSFWSQNSHYDTFVKAISQKNPNLSECVDLLRLIVGQFPRYFTEAKHKGILRTLITNLEPSSGTDAKESGK